MSNKLENQRLAELHLIKSFLKPGMRVLEIGGGSGFQASVMTSWGCKVTSLDLKERIKPKKEYFMVQDYDGLHVQQTDNYFDLIFTSNVLEHVSNLPELLAEMKRVLKYDGLIIHILPSASWRLWTSLAHYPFVVKYLFLREKALHSISKAPTVSKVMSLKGMLRVLFAGPHGISRSAISELFVFTRRQWLHTFKKNGFTIIKIIPNGIFYTGYDLLPALPQAPRKLFARIFGSACNIFILGQSGPYGIV